MALEAIENFKTEEGKIEDARRWLRLDGEWMQACVEVLSIKYQYFWDVKDHQISGSGSGEADGLSYRARTRRSVFTLALVSKGGSHLQVRGVYVSQQLVNARLERERVGSKRGGATGGDEARD